MLGYHQVKAWPVEQKALPPQFYVASVTTGIRTHTLLIKHQCLNPVLLTARLCDCVEPQTMRHMIDDCPLSHFDGGIKALHLAEDPAVNWIVDFKQDLHSIRHHQPLGHDTSITQTHTLLIVETPELECGALNRLTTARHSQ